MGSWLRAWISLGFAMMLRGKEIVEIKFQELVNGVDEEGDDCILFLL